MSHILSEAQVTCNLADSLISVPSEAEHNCNVLSAVGIGNEPLRFGVMLSKAIVNKGPGGKGMNLVAGQTERGGSKPRKFAPHSFFQQYSTVQELACHIQAGHPYTFGMLPTDGTASKCNKDVLYIDACALDFDNKHLEIEGNTLPAVTIADILAHPFIKQFAAIVQESSSSGKGGVEKLRVVLVFPYRLSPENFKAVYAALRDLFPLSDSATSAISQGWYGALGKAPLLMQDVTLSQEFVDEAIKRGMMKAPRKPSKAPQTAGVGFGTAQAPKLSPAAPLRAENWDNDSVFDFARKNFDQSERLDFYLKAIRDCPLGHRHNLLYGVVLRTPWAWGKAKSVVTAAIVQAAIDGGWDESEAERVVSDAMAVVDAEADLPVAQRRWKQWAALFPTLKFDIRTQELWAPDYTPDTDYLRYQNTAEYGSSLKDAEFVKELMQWAKNERGFDPLLDAFHKITQDCEMSVDEALRAFDELAELLNADDKERVSRLLQIWFIGSVNRILNPGAIFQRMLVLTGAGGIGKSAFFSIFDLGNGSAEAEHFDGNGFDSSELAEFNRHTFAVIDEMDKITGKYAQAALKGFITRCIDSYRLRWKAQAINVPRGYVLGGTVNGDAPLNDDGAELRRYLPILVTGEGAVIGKKRAAWYLANKTRIWQAAYTLFQAGFDSELSDEEIVREAEIVQNFVTRSGSFSKLAVLVGKINANNELLGRKSGPGFLLNDLIEFANNRPSHRPPSRTEILDAAKALKLRGWKAKDVTIDGIRHSSVWAPSHYTKVLGIGTAQDVSQLITMSNFEPRG